MATKREIHNYVRDRTLRVWLHKWQETQIGRPGPMSKITAPDFYKERFMADSIKIIAVAFYINSLLFATTFFFGANQGVPNGGAELRLTLKFVVFFLLLLALCMQNKVSVSRFFVLLPAIYVWLYPAIFPLFEMDPLHLQAINSVFVLPILFYSFDAAKAQFILRHASICLLIGVAINIAFYDVVLFENRAFVGTLGNPNSFGLVCIFSILTAGCIQQKQLGKVVVFTALVGLLLSGSLINVLILAGLIAWYFKRWLSVYVFLAPISLLALPVLTALKPVTHSTGKLSGFLNSLFSFKYPTGAASIDTRIVYFFEAFSLFFASPLSFLFGHSGGLVYFSGDGGLLGYLVTHGILVTVAYLSVLLFIIRRGIGSKIHATRAMGFFLLFYLLYTLVNRIHDYWGVLFYVFLGISIILSLNQKSVQSERQ